jgi:hypothetical protein
MSLVKMFSDSVETPTTWLKSRPHNLNKGERKMNKQNEPILCPNCHRHGGYSYHDDKNTIFYRCKTCSNFSETDMDGAALSTSESLLIKEEMFAVI